MGLATSADNNNIYADEQVSATHVPECDQLAPDTLATTTTTHSTPAQQPPTNSRKGSKGNGKANEQDQGPAAQETIAQQSPYPHTSESTLDTMAVFGSHMEMGHSFVK